MASLIGDTITHQNGNIYKTIKTEDVCKSDGSRWLRITLEPLWVKHINAKRKRESRPLFRLRRWFLSLRWVNNWMWRRGNKVENVYVPDRCPQATPKCRDCDYWAYCLDHEYDNTGILPDYPSIQELSQNISEDGLDLKAVDEAKERDDFVDLGLDDA